MKNGSNKKILIILGILMLVIFSGYSIFETIPKLINSDKPFIDLSGSIGDSIGSANKAYEKDVLSPVPTETVPTDVPPEPTDTPIETEPDKKELRIIVGDTLLSGAGERISLEGTEKDYSGMGISSADELKKTLKNEDISGITIILVDNYAEVKAYREAEKILMELEIEFLRESTK